MCIYIYIYIYIHTHTYVCLHCSSLFARALNATRQQDQTAKAKKSIWELLPRARVSRRVSAAFAAVCSMRQSLTLGLHEARR